MIHRVSSAACWRIGLFVALWALSPMSATQAQDVATLREVAVYPSLILHNGKIATMDARLTFHEAMAVRGTRIWRLGRNDQIRPLAGPETQVIDLKGRTVIPGIIDAHTHPHLWGLWHLGAKIDPQLDPVFLHADTVEQIRSRLGEAIQKRISELGKSKWVSVNIPWQLEAEARRQGVVTEEVLDKLAPENPVLIESGYGGAFPNTMAKQLMTKNLGKVVEGLRARYFVPHDIILRDRVRDIADFLAEEMAENSSYGLTTFGSHIEPLNVIRGLRLLDEQQRMPMRFAWVHRPAFTLSANPAEFYRLYGDIVGTGSDYFWNMGVGGESWGGGCTVAVGLTEQIRERDRRTACQTVPGQRDFDGLLAAVKSHLRVAILHATSDGMLDGAFQLATEAMKPPDALTLDEVRNMRWGFEHGLRIRPEQPAMAARFGFFMSFQATQYSRERLEVLENYGEQYIPWIQPAKSWLDAGGKMILSTDAHIGALSEDGERMIHDALIRDWHYRDSVWPWLAFYITRELNGKVWTPSERIDRISALRGWTSWAAEYVLKEKDIGTLEVGKLADFAVIDRDFFTIPEKEIWEIKNLMTGLGGKIVYRSPSF
jgi:predicted amidohydrolase YtcJ